MKATNDERGGRVAAWWRRGADGRAVRWDHVRAALGDWRYPAALAAAMLLTSVLIAQVVTLRGYQDVLDGLSQRAATAECVDRHEAEYERAVAVYLRVASEDPPPTPARQAQAAQAVMEAVDKDEIEACYAAERAD